MRIKHFCLCLLLSITLLSGVVLLSSFVFADDSSVTVTTITVPVACTLRGTGTDSHTATLAPNTYSGASGSEYQNGIGKTTLTAICNDDNGFSIYAIGYTGNSYDSENHTKLVGNSLGGTIATKAYASGDTASNWSMKLTKVTDSTVSYNPTNLTISTGYDTWHAIPDTYTKVAQYKANTGSSTTDTTLGVKLETTYAAYIASNQPADTYVGQVKYTMVHPYDEQPLQPQTATSGCINYFPNGSNVEGTMGCQSVSTSATSATLLASNFSRQGYGFAGWSNKFDYATNPTQEGIKFYGPQETITFTAGDYTGSNPGLSLYAVWVKSQGNLQDTSKVTTVCSGLTTAPIDGTANLNSVSALTDSRDNQTYAIAKLADNKCWMIENLRLADKDSSNNDIDLSSTNTNNPSLPITNVYDTTNPTTSNHLSPSVNPTTTAWCTNTNAACYDQSMLNTDNYTNRASSPATNTNINMYSYGAYYNWYSATAGNGKYSTSTNNSATAGDICPSGWTLPEGGNKTNIAAEKNDFYKLGLSLGLSAPANYESSTYPDWTGTPEGSTASTKYRSYPNNFLYSGRVYGSSVGGRGSLGGYWSKSVYGSSGAYDLYFDSRNVSPSFNSDKYYGFSVRCLAQ